MFRAQGYGFVHIDGRRPTPFIMDFDLTYSVCILTFCSVLTNLQKLQNRS